MKVMSLWNPWATLMVIGEKTIETRSRNMHYRGVIGIHASALPSDKKTREEREALCKTWPFSMYISDYYDLSFGKILGTVIITGSAKTEWVRRNHKQLKIPYWEEEEKFGDYTAGRYGIFTRKPIEWKTPVLAKGSQILPWEFDDNLIPSQIF